MTFFTGSPANPGEQAFLELQVAVDTVGSFQSATQHADSKAGMLIAVYAGLAAFVSTRAGADLPGLIRAGHWDWRLVAAVGVLVVFSAATVATGVALLRAVRPRLTPPPEENRFAFPTVADRFARGVVLPRAGADEMCAEAWSMAGAMAVIALAKHNDVRRAVHGMTAMLVTAVLAMWTLS
ncbi:hypothetical protein [Dactylosporangium sp. CA-092794]|uniref:hypothetical protein n=1 Tax=Dactylosporangium sp. CA-092794 TaxID=3239929 RepID=UPI003D91B3F2